MAPSAIEASMVRETERHPKGLKRWQLTLLILAAILFWFLNPVIRKVNELEQQERKLELMKFERSLEPTPKEKAEKWMLELDLEIAREKYIRDRLGDK